MKTFSHLKLWQSLVLIVVVGVAPMVAITLFVITVSINKDIDFGRWERYGLVYQRPLERILDALPSYRAACLPSAAAGERESAVRRIDEGFASLAAAQENVGAELQFTAQALAARQREAAHPDVLHAEWTRLRSMSPEAVLGGDPVAVLVGHVRQAIAHAGDMSNLILDPDLDSYYIMDITLCALPQTQERLGRIVPQVRDWLAAGETGAHAAEIAAMAALLGEADMGRIDGDTQTAINEDPNFYGRSDSLQARLPAAAKAYQTANQALQVQLQQLAAGAAAPGVAVFDALAEAAKAESLRFWNLAADELDGLLATRIRAYQHKRTLSLCGIGLAVLVSGLLTGWFVRRLQRTLRRVSGILGQNARRLVEIVGQVHASGEKLATSSSEQAASLEETSSSVEELASMSHSNVDTARQVSDLMGTTRRTAEGAEGEMRGLAGAMIKLKTSSADIAKIVKTIDEIAFQTNLLALNAAVEAARAGESGAGFAVVADEVRSLAQRSAAAARQTAVQIEAAITHAENGADISGTVELVLQDIVRRVREIDAHAKEVATASQEQSTGIGQINVALEQLSQTTQSTAATAEESSAIAVELSQQVVALDDSVAVLAGLVGGGDASDENPDIGGATRPAKDSV